MTNDQQNLQYVNGKRERVVVMNHKTKQCNCFENNDILGFLNDLVETHICEIWFVKFVHHHLQMFLPYIVYHLDCLWKF